jgi:hypothetical protein
MVPGLNSTLSEAYSGRVEEGDVFPSITGGQKTDVHKCTLSGNLNANEKVPVEITCETDTNMCADSYHFKVRNKVNIHILLCLSTIHLGHNQNQPCHPAFYFSQLFFQKKKCEFLDHLNVCVFVCLHLFLTRF